MAIDSALSCQGKFTIDPDNIPLSILKLELLAVLELHKAASSYLLTIKVCSCIS